MMTHSKIIRNIIKIIKAIIWLSILFTFLAILSHILTRTGVFNNWFDTHRLSFDYNGIQLFPKKSDSIWSLIFPILSNGVHITFLYFILRFLINIDREQFFSVNNVRIMGICWKLSLLLSLLLGNFYLTGSPIEVPFRFELTFHFPFILTALIFWILEKVIERGVDITRENELTI
ncbi:DUF2975 domain-containing protein [Streptococcus sp. DD10]|uniref:DUF2975 domain-containing protein n=1 Tax=Streptococcus sp. DD10 TaxID=1777878 RepID=UPI00082C27C9|nr:DUF2975 domain-containing protein [Streptococcus sp. DD10]